MSALAKHPSKWHMSRGLTSYCDRCDGCGWYEGGTALMTRCEECGGTGLVFNPQARKVTAKRKGRGE